MLRKAGFMQDSGRSCPPLPESANGLVWGSALAQQRHALADLLLGNVEAVVRQGGVVRALGVLNVAEVEEPLGLAVELVERGDLLLGEVSGRERVGKGVLEGGELIADIIDRSKPLALSCERIIMHLQRGVE